MSLSFLWPATLTRLAARSLLFSTVAISMVKNEKESVYCIVFHDVDDVSETHVFVLSVARSRVHACGTRSSQGATLGNIIANQILRSFLDLHRGKLRGVTNVAQFASFGNKLPEVLTGVFFTLCTKRIRRAREKLCCFLFFFVLFCNLLSRYGVFSVSALFWRSEV